MKHDDLIRHELLALLDSQNAHMAFREAVADFPLEQINIKPPNTPYSFWHFVEHIRIAQWDILEFIRNPQHQSPPYPEGYRPRPEEVADERRWRQSVEAVSADLAALLAIVSDQGCDLLAPLPHAPDYTIYREVLIAADHMAYHVGEIAVMRQVMGLWPANRPYLTGV
ncbi:DinB family protein [Geobacter sp. DSM 9736]|uniref:DinB family protein n=1 Tax=Geobacter sp. DSM 9736 TaxID=1277350 RepID=UPI000B50ED80|nr:DinB family protein [Geobacter sp. DSM 9736]SNB45867.1 DinB superfamily protein [Geobacter sp. DSM 9736]